MAKAGMRRPDPKEPHGTESNHKTHIPKNTVPPVPEIQGKAKCGKEKQAPYSKRYPCTTTCAVQGFCVAS
ncbi:MAG: hypothetical protein RR528_07090 [Angelakisella sp.]